VLLHLLHLVLDHGVQLVLKLQRLQMVHVSEKTQKKRSSIVVKFELVYVKTSDFLLHAHGPVSLMLIFLHFLTVYVNLLLTLNRDKLGLAA
jgi:hypothetical protein